MLGMSTFESTGARWAGIVRAQAASGLTVAAFCAQRGLAVSTFYPWKRRLASAAAAPRAATSAPAFVEAMVAPTDGPDERGVTIVLGAAGPGTRRVLVGPGFDPRLLLDVLDTLERGDAADGAAP